eukprot:1065282-Prymnesium_polylepis.1
MAAAHWRTATAAPVIGVTRSRNPEREEAFLAEGITPKLREELEPEMGTAPGSGQYAHVLFCASPGGNDDYVHEVECATRLWDAEAPGGRFVFTSSAGVYAEQDGNVVTESSPTASTPRAAKLLAAEERVIAAGGTVIRLAGLYLLFRGAHNAWLSMEEVKSGGADGLINQVRPGRLWTPYKPSATLGSHGHPDLSARPADEVHYDDAAAAAVAALLRAPRGETLHVADDEPLSRHAICVQACRAPQFADRTIPSFTGAGGRGKVIDSSHTRA